MGADVSLLPFMQQQGVVFKSNGTPAAPEKILYDAGANLFRIRLFVTPETTYTNTNVGAIQSLAYDIALAQRLKAAAPRAKILLDFHYSDTWADPGHQALPAAWAGQTGNQLAATVRQYTSSTLAAFGAAGVMPDMIQVGNETNAGMLWPAGTINFSGTAAQQRSSWAAYGSLVSAAIAGVRDAQNPASPIQVALHVANGDTDGSPQFFFSRLTSSSYGNVALTSFDTIGLSYYPDSAADLSILRDNLSDLATTYGKKLLILETNAPWKSTSVANDPAYANTPAGQQQFLTDLRNVMFNVPNGLGQGVVYWYPEAVQVPGHFVYNGGATALFDSSGNALPALTAFAVPEAHVGLWLAVPLLGVRRRARVGRVSQIER